MSPLRDLRLDSSARRVLDRGVRRTWDLRSNALRPRWTSADAAGLPILAGLVRYEEVAAGRIDHAIRVTAPVTQRSYVWPARHQAGSTSGDRSADGGMVPAPGGFRHVPSGPAGPGGGRGAQVHGMVLADNGSSWYMSGAPDERWDNDDLRTLSLIKGTDLVAVDTAPLKVSPDSGQAPSGSACGWPASSRPARQLARATVGECGSCSSTTTPTPVTVTSAGRSPLWAPS